MSFQGGVERGGLLAVLMAQEKKPFVSLLVRDLIDLKGQAEGSRSDGVDRVSRLSQDGCGSPEAA